MSIYWCLCGGCIVIHFLALRASRHENEIEKMWMDKSMDASSNNISQTQIQEYDQTTFFYKMFIGPEQFFESHT